jgi:NAD(P)-dependent dehydrogenase (short-subunit alcohol dehydrogenase family)
LAPRGDEARYHLGHRRRAAKAVGAPALLIAPPYHTDHGVPWREPIEDLGHGGAHIRCDIGAEGGGAEGGTDMIIELSGKQAVVTGSTSGIGFGIARGLAQAGAAVVINGRSQKNVDAATRRLREEAPQANVAGIAADLATAAGVAAFVARVGATDILVNNLGIFEPKPFAEISDADWQRFFETNVMSGVRMSRHYLPAMVAKGWGRVVFISSESGLNIPVEMVHYGMTKTAQLAISRGLAESVAGTGVTVNAVLPGPTRSEGVVDFFAKLAGEQGMSAEALEKQFIATHRPTSLTRPLASVEEVANMVVYVCSPQASATTGAALRVDGGVVRSIA